MKNIVYIDGQNFHLGITEWKVDYKRFRVYLKDKYKVETAYYFFGYTAESQQLLYENLQKAGFIVVFKEHKDIFISKKKGNVDTDIVFEMMRSVIEKDFNKIVLVSGDGDYKKVVDYLLKKEKFEKILFPNQKSASSLYKKLTSHYYVNLSQKSLISKLKYERRGDRKH